MRTVRILCSSVMMMSLFLSSDILLAQESKDLPVFKLSFIERFRFTTWDNAIGFESDLDNGQTFTRQRTSLDALWIPSPSIEFRAKLTNEFRVFLKHPAEPDFNLHEVFFDNLYFKWKCPIGLPLELILGRQNIMLGEGFVIMDAHPLDGSRSIYFNAARMDVLFNDANRLILFYAYQPRTDTILPIIKDRDQRLIEQPEEAIAAYFTGRIGRIRLDVYAIRKNVESTNEVPVESHINTLGSRFVLPMADRFSLTGEAAYQLGRYDEFDRNAWGGYFHLDYKTDGSGLNPNSVTFGGIALSGDDGQTADVEGWDPLFSRWPKWSESFIYTQIIEYSGRIGYWSNFASLYGTFKFQFLKSLDLSLTYHQCFAFEAMPWFQSYPFGEGTNRGGLFIAKANFKICKPLTGHLLYETMGPGNFYHGGADRYHWFRLELMYRADLIK